MHTTHHPDPRLDTQFYDGVPAKRLVAWVLDLIVVIGICLACIIASLGLMAFFIPLLALAANFCYRSFCLHKWSATLGMRALGIEVRNTNGDRLTTTQALFHTGLFIFIFMSVLGIFANILSILLNDKGQALHDLLLGTVVINCPAD
ncbi:RDD family protein [Neptunicoccus sediminis]|uniref:RDD family protein n=1 Tax=Neptunicoccus sediminis TaxID=1892596 RepID=UPI0008461945|nr:RDD family protein [Neptunicoccus sediminis]